MAWCLKMSGENFYLLIYCKHLGYACIKKIAKIEYYKREIHTQIITNLVTFKVNKYTEKCQKNIAKNHSKSILK